MQSLAIVGTHPETRALAPFDDAGVDIWVFNEAPRQDWCRRYSAVFQIHAPEVYSSPNNWIDKGYWTWLQQAHGKPVYMQAVDPRVPDSVRYPLDEIMAELPGAALGWFSSSAAYALALALHQGYRDIAIYGMRLASSTEYAYQLRNFNFWAGVALGMGARLDLTPVIEDFSGRRYGYEGETQIESGVFARRVEELDAEWHVANKVLHYAKDRLDACMLERKFDDFAELASAYHTASLECGEKAGAMAEAGGYAKRSDPITQQEFERRAAQAQRDGEDKRVLSYHAGGKVEYVFNVWRQTGNFEALRQLRLFLGEQQQYAYDAGAMLGAYRENMRYWNALDERITAAGGYRTLAALGVTQ